MLRLVDHSTSAPDWSALTEVCHLELQAFLSYQWGSCFHDTSIPVRLCFKNNRSSTTAADFLLGLKNVQCNSVSLWQNYSMMQHFPFQNIWSVQIIMQWKKKKSANTRKSALCDFFSVCLSVPWLHCDWVQVFHNIHSKIIISFPAPVGRENPKNFCQ